MRRILAMVGVAAAALFTSASPAHAQFDGARTYWPLPKNTNIVNGFYINGEANASFSNFTSITPNVDISSDVYMLSYTRVQPLFGRSILWTGILPAATMSTNSTLPLPTDDSFVNGLGDITLGATINIFGAPEMMAYEWLRNDIGFVMWAGVNVTAPTGAYDSDQTLNVGSNQWKTRLSLPMIQSFGRWRPGERFTLEVTPTITFFSDNEDAPGGGSFEQDPMYSVEVHLTHDMTRDAYLSLDYTWLSGAEQTFYDSTGALLNETDGIDAQLIGATLGFQVNDNMSLHVTHMQALDESDGGVSLEGSVTKIRLTWAWHDVLQRVQDFGE
ncbi:MAG: transporter [Hyphomonadaceae bacterium]